MCAPPTPIDDTKARNLNLAYAFTLAAGAARGVWSYAVLSGYLYVLTGGSNARVGLAEGAQGIAQCACGLLAGWAADRFRRRTVCRVACVTGVVAISWRRRRWHRRVAAIACLWRSRRAVPRSCSPSRPIRCGGRFGLLLLPLPPSVCPLDDLAPFISLSFGCKLSPSPLLLEGGPTRKGSLVHNIIGIICMS